MAPAANDFGLRVDGSIRHSVSTSAALRER
jgi:hypothetical protein